MNPGERIEIPLSKAKLVMMLSGALLFVAVGCWFVLDPPAIRNAFWGNPTRLAVLGYASIIFFGFCAGVLIRKLPDKKPGLIIDGSGLIDNSGGLSAGRILWADILSISILEIQRQKLLMLEVKNPEAYISRQRSLFKRKGMELNHRMYGTPLSITANALKVPFGELFDLLQRRLEEKRGVDGQDVMQGH